MSLTESLLATARDAGASAVGITGAEPFPEALAHLEASRREGLSGPLGFTYRDPETATDVTRSFPWARSLIVFGVSYIDRAPAPAATGPVIARFATVDHYRAVRAVAAALSARLEEAGARTETLIDDNRLADRAAAIRAGIGWKGRSTMVLTPGHGPWMLLGTVATDAHLETSAPMIRGCGTCTACIPACPTGAIADGVLDSRRCLSTWLQTAGSLPHWVRPVLGRRVYGCDDCLTSCPPGFAALGAGPPPDPGPGFEDLLAWDDDSLVDRFGWWFVPRRDGRFIRRNLLVAGANSGEPEPLDAIIGHLDHRSSMIRGHAAWAVARSGIREAPGLIRRALAEEKAPEAREEMMLALVMLQRPILYAELMELDEMVTTTPRYRGLALLGADLASGEIGAAGLEPVLCEDEAPPATRLDLLAGLIRVNDRDRVLEGIRSRARRELEIAG